MIRRRLSKKLLQAAKQFPVVALMGPRQSGKTTLVKEVFPEMKYISLEDLFGLPAPNRCQKKMKNIT